ncbi:hypothetical protein STEG23_026719 [Scotinomys teguina]
MTVTPLGRDQDCSLKNRESDVPTSWFLDPDPGGWSKTAAVTLYFIFPGICTLSLINLNSTSVRCSGWLFQLSLEVLPPLMFPMTVTPLGRDQDCSLKIREPDVPAPWFQDPGGWSKTAAVRLFFIFPGICTLSLLSILLGFVGGFISFIKCQSTIEGLDSISLVTLSRVTVSAIVSCTPEAIGPLTVQLPLKRRAPYLF